MTDYNGIYNKLTKKELLITLMTRDFMVDNRRKEVMQLKNKLALTEKALELACKWINDTQEMDSDCPIYDDCFRVEKDCDNWDCENCDCSKFAIEHFKTKAKEMMKSE